MEVFHRALRILCVKIFMRRSTVIRVRAARYGKVFDDGFFANNIFDGAKFGKNLEHNWLSRARRKI